MRRILMVIDDEQAIRDSLQMILEYQKYAVVLASNGLEALEKLKLVAPEVILLDIKMPGMDGMEVLQKIKATYPQIVVIMISAHGTFQTAVEATKNGAYDFLEKPLDRDRILITVKNALEQNQLFKQNQALKKSNSTTKILGHSSAIHSVLQMIEKVAPSEARVFIQGENGTGKELVARAIHELSKRAHEAFIAINCAAIPEELVESELFGHEKGAFTGASTAKIGKFELADRGTIFLDEIGDMTSSAQSKVLRVLQENIITRVGGSKDIEIDVRVISATNKDLEAMVREETFREDLFYRLNVVPIVLPPLRERTEDIAILATAFLEEFCKHYGVEKKVFAPEALKSLCARSWPGNIRELRNVVERLVILTSEKVIAKEDIDMFKSGAKSPQLKNDLYEGCSSFEEFKNLSEKIFLENKLNQYNWNVAITAKELKMQRSNLYKKLEKYGLKG
ncbi:MAG: sigma-54 dependent transcriptional regulator [Planctomycetota bacterium]